MIITSKFLVCLTVNYVLYVSLHCSNVPDTQIRNYRLAKC